MGLSLLLAVIAATAVTANWPAMVRFWMERVLPVLGVDVHAQMSDPFAGALFIVASLYVAVCGGAWLVGLMVERVVDVMARRRNRRNLTGRA